ncbi:MAG: hypothetical protein GY829_01350 [Gammaproteobacteria bacterium]|nr:hypothetical protein [Gammaproteobacteria bacterium]MCP4324173.1 hypothetical protein [Alteromonadales bacterium]MCP4802003.1 hypothetical protein [Bacteroidota bacterium]
MIGKRKSFVLHKDSLDILPDLTDEQAGKLFKAIYAYQIDQEEQLDQITKLVFLPFKNQFLRDDAKYKETCERRAAAGSKGGKQKVANASKSKQKVANVADSVSKSKNKSDSKSEVIKDKEPKAPKFDFKNELLLLGVDKQVLDDWLIVRKKKNASNTKTAFNGLIREVEKSGLSVGDAVEVSAQNSWTGFKAQWYANLKPNQINSRHNIANQNYKSGDL